MLRIKISKQALDNTYTWSSEVWRTGHDKPIVRTRHISRRNAQRAGNEAIRRLEKKTRRGAFDWRFYAGDNFPRAWGWLEYSASATTPDDAYLHVTSKIVRATAGLPIQVSWQTATETITGGTLMIRAPFKTAWGSRFTEKHLRQNNPNIRVDWEERDWPATLEHAFEEEE